MSKRVDATQVVADVLPIEEKWGHELFLIIF